MTQEEYKKKLLELQDEFTEKKKEVAKEYAFSNNPHKIGDIITDHSGSKLKIEKIKWSYGYGAPACVYYGIELKKDLTPTKRQQNTSIHQSSIISNE